jgi:hypothetical protein
MLFPTHFGLSLYKPMFGVPPVPSLLTVLLSKLEVSMMETVPLEPSIHVQIVIGKNLILASQLEDGMYYLR